MKADEYVENLKATHYLCCCNPRIVALCNEIVESSNSKTDREKAIALHDYVRDRIKFGFTPAFHEQTALQVLDSGVGFGYTKGTLFQALLRAAGIPARPIFTDINSEILYGVFHTTIPYVDHMITEVYLNGKWIKTDSYIIDEMLFTVGKRLLLRDIRVMGYGFHIDGNMVWNGKDDQFVQFVMDSPKNVTSSLSLMQDNYLRGFEDVQDFYEREINTKSEMNIFIKSIAFPIICMLAHRNLQRIRKYRYRAEVVK